MKKIFSFLSLLLLTCSMAWAVAPDYESYDWNSADAMAAGLAGSASVTISVTTGGSDGNISGHWYKPLNSAIDGSATGLGTHLTISSAQQIDSIAVFFCPNGTSSTNIAWAGWGTGVTPSKEVGTNYGTTASVTSSKSWADATWQTIDLSEKSIYTIYLSRQGKKLTNGGKSISNFGDNQTVNVLGIRVWLKENRVINTQTLGGVKINDALADPAAYSVVGNSITLTNSFVSAPTIALVNHITYTDSSTKDEDVAVTMSDDGAGHFTGTGIIGATTYSVIANKLASATVTYKDGDVTLGSELVALNAHPAEYATYQYKALYSFVGWYNNPDLAEGHRVTIASETITADATYYGKWEKVYASSVNIEQLVLDNGKGYNLMSLLGTLGYATNMTNDLDSLNDEKTKRNEPYLGQKAKAAGKLLNFRVAAGQAFKVKFGNVGTKPQVSINGGNYEDMTITNGVYTYPAGAEAEISIKTASDKTVVFKQIQIGADPQIAEVVLPATSAVITLGTNGWSTYAATYNYTVSGATVYKAAYDAVKNAVVLTEVENAVVPAEEGIILKGTEGDEITINSTTNAVSDFAGNKLVGTISEKTAPANAYVISTNAGVTMFNPIDPDADPAIKIPAHKAYMIIAPAQGAPSAIRIIEGENNATDIKSIEGSEKAVKFIENGKLYILREGVVYDVTGAKVK